MTVRKPCLDCGRLFDPSDGWNRCELHRKGRDRPRYRGSAAARGYGAEHQQLRKRVIREHLDRHGLMCPGWLVPPHPVNHSTELQLDHVIPVIDGGPGTYENAQVLCGRCNRRKGASSPVAPIVSPAVNLREQPRPPKPKDRPVFIR